MQKYSVSVNVFCEVPLSPLQGIATAEVLFSCVITAKDAIEAADEAVHAFNDKSGNMIVVSVTHIDVVPEGERK